MPKLIASTLLIAASGFFATHAKAADEILFTPTSCYEVMKPDFEVSPETLKKMHDRLLKGNSDDYRVVMESTVGADGLSVSRKILQKTDIEELNDAAETITEVAAIKCKGAMPKVFQDSITFGLDYIPGTLKGTVKAKPYFSRFVAPLEMVNAPFEKQVANGICKVGKFNDQTGAAEGVDCTYDGYCKVVGDLVRPRFPKMQETRGAVGKLQIGMKVTKDGIVESTSVHVSSGTPEFDEAAQKAAAMTKFTCSGSKPLEEYGITYVFAY